MPDTPGQRIKQLREQRHMSQEALADEAKVSSGYISKLERDFYASPGTVKLSRIAEVLGVSLEYFTGVPRPSKARQRAKTELDRFLDDYLHLSDDDREEIAELTHHRRVRRERPMGERREGQGS